MAKRRNRRPPPIQPATAAYQKAPLSVQDSLKHLAGKGLVIPQPANAEAQLQRIGHHRLLIYCRPLQSSQTKQFVAGTTFDQVVTLYDFDRKLRLLCLDAIEMLEVSLRAIIGSDVAVPHGCHFYVHRQHFDSHDGWREFQKTAFDASSLAIGHYYRHYHSPDLPPIWAVLEAATFGKLSRLFSSLHLQIRKTIALRYGYDESLLQSWFKALNYLRNLCAHHNRVWDFKMLVNRPKAARALPELINTDTFYARAVIIVALLKAVDPLSDWNKRLSALIQQYPQVTASNMGFPANWQQLAMWL